MTEPKLRSLIAHSKALTSAYLGVDDNGNIFGINEDGSSFAPAGSMTGLLLSELRAATGVVDGDIKYLRGHSTPGDGGEGIFRWSTTSAVDDGGTRLNAGGLGSNATGWRRIYEGPLDIRWFGAIGDGSTNDAVAIQRALDSTASLSVFVPPGKTFAIGAQLVFSQANLVLFGGPGSRIKALTDDFDMIEIRADDCAIENLELWGAANDNTTTQYGVVTNCIPGYIQGSGQNFAAIANNETLIFSIDGTPYTVTFVTGDTTLAKVISRVNKALGNGEHLLCCVEAVNGTDMAIASRSAGTSSTVAVTGGTAATKCGVSGLSDTGEGYRAQRCTIRGVKFYGAGSSTRLNNGIKVLAGCDYWRVEDCVFQLMGFSGVTGNGYALNTGARGLMLKNCMMLGDANGGRHLVYLGGGARDCQIVGNTITNANANGINGTSLAYQLPNVNNLVSNNTISNQAESADDFAFAAISLTGGFYNTLVTGNVIRDIGDQGIYFSGLGRITDHIATPHDTVIRGNTIFNCGKAGINLETVTRCDVVDNLIVDVGKKTAATYAGIQVQAYTGSTTICDRVSVRDNRILSTDRAAPFYIYAVRFDPTATQGPSNSELIGNTMDPGSSGTIVMSSDTPAIARRNHGTTADADVSITVGIEPWRELLGGYPGLPTSYTGLWLGPTISPTASNFAIISSGTTETYVNVPQSGGSLHFTVANAIRATVTNTGVALKDSAGNTLIQTDSTAKVGVFGNTPVVRTSAYTQTYSTATRTHSNPTGATLTDSSGGTADQTVANPADPADSPGTADVLRDDLVANTLPVIRNNFADVTDEINKLIADVANIKQVLNQVLDDLQAYGWLQ